MNNDKDIEIIDFLTNITPLTLVDRKINYKLNMQRSETVNKTIQKAKRYFSENQLIKKIWRIDKPINGIDFDIPVYICNREIIRKSNSYEKPKPIKAISNFSNCHSFGKGQTEEQAFASCICEGLERSWAASWEGRNIWCRSYNDVKEYAILPSDIDNLSEDDFRRYKKYYSDSSIAPNPWYHPKFFRFHEDLKIDWTWGFSLSSESAVLAPAISSLIHFSPTNDAFFCNQMNTNGLSLGNNLEEAILQGFFEVIERDSVMIFMRAPVVLPDVDLESFPNDFIRATVKKCRSANIELIVKDFTTDLGIPVFCAQIFNNTGYPKYIYGLGSHLDSEIALTRAISEVFQGFFSHLHMSELFNDEMSDIGLTQPHHTGLNKNEDNFCKTFKDYSIKKSDNLKEDIGTCLKMVNKHSMDIVVIPIKSDEDFSVVKVLVPGSATCDQRRPPIFLSDRVYTVPKNMGYIDRNLTLDDLYLEWIFI